MTGPYFIGSSGGKHYYTALADLIRRFHPDLVDAHISDQLEALGLRVEFDAGYTPHALPYSFSDYEVVTT